MSIPLSQGRKDLMLRTMDGVTDLGGTMHILHHYKFCDNILTWMICHGLTGKRLAEAIVKQFGNSVPALVDFVVSAANQGDISNDRTLHTGNTDR